MPGNKGANFLFGGVCRIVTIPFTLSIRADKENTIFTGKLLPGTVLSMADFLDILAEKFKVAPASVPAPVRSLYLKNLGFSYQTTGNIVTFICTGGFCVDDVQVEMSVYIAIGSLQTTFSGQITINNLNFSVCFDRDGRDLFIATYNKTPTTAPDISLHELIKSISTTWGRFIPESFRVDLQEIKFVFHNQDKQKKFLFGLRLSAGIDLKDMPVIGDKLPDSIKLSVQDLQILFASESFSKEQVESINSLFLFDKKISILFPPEGIAKGLHISGELQVLEFIIPLNSGNKEAGPVVLYYTEPFTGQLEKTDSSPPVSPDRITWFNVQKKLGPVLFQRIGVAFSDGTLSFALDASLALGPVQLTMSGLTLDSSISEFKPVFGLHGFFMSLKTAGFELGGGFLRTFDEGYEAYYGIVSARIASCSFNVFGGHTPARPDPVDPQKKLPAAFFLYAHIEIPIGGPPCFSLNGFAGGFGINNQLILPTLEELPGYILLPGPNSKAPKQEVTPEATIKSVLPQMQKYFIPEPGQYWMAAGISFSSFRMIEAFAVVTVSFGVDFQIALLGSCAMTFPKGSSHPVAYIEIVIRASYTQSTGLLAIEGVVKPASFIFGDFCRITGGFAFYIWIDPPVVTGGARPGDFLVSIGGYHPAFTVPDYYPKLPRLEITFNLLPLQVSGEAYFAITSAMLMAGARLKAVWKFLNIKAWFELNIDFIMAWAPFAYFASGYICVGCSVDFGLFTLKVSIGAFMDVWGPPFGGKAKIDLGIIAFTIFFGQDKETDPPLLKWNEFKDRFLPADTAVQQPDTVTGTYQSHILKATVAAGLHKADVYGYDWIIDSDNFVIHIQSFIPANRLRIATGETVFKELPSRYNMYNNPHPPVEEPDMPYLLFSGTKPRFSSTNVWNPQVHIKPMGKNNLDSVLDITLSVMDTTGRYTACVVALTIRPIVEDAAGALWDMYSGNTCVDDPAFLASALTGVEITPIPRLPSVVNNVRIEQLLFKQGNKYYFGYERPFTDTTYEVVAVQPDTDTLEIEVREKEAEPVHMVNKDYVLSAIRTQWTTERRNTILQNLVETGFDVYSYADPESFGSQTALTDWPEILKLGDTL